MSDMKTAQDESHQDIEGRVRRSCAGQYALANMFKVVAQDYIHPKIRELATAGQVSRIQVEGLSLRIVEVWNPIILDMNDNPILFNQSTAEKTKPEDETLGF